MRLKNNIVHVIWSITLTTWWKMQEVNKYQRKLAWKVRADRLQGLRGILRRGRFRRAVGGRSSRCCARRWRSRVVVVWAIPVDYADNYKLMAQMNFSQMI